MGTVKVPLSRRSPNLVTAAQVISPRNPFFTSFVLLPDYLSAKNELSNTPCNS